MEGFILFTTILLVLTYVGIAVWTICKRESVAGSVGTAAAFLGGGLVVVSIAEAVATFLCWAIVIGIILAIIGAVLGG